MSSEDIYENLGESHHCKNLRFENLVSPIWKWGFQNSSRRVAITQTILEIKGGTEKDEPTGEILDCHRKQRKLLIRSENVNLRWATSDLSQQVIVYYVEEYLTNRTITIYPINKWIFTIKKKPVYWSLNSASIQTFEIHTSTIKKNDC